MPRTVILPLLGSSLTGSTRRCSLDQRPPFIGILELSKPSTVLGSNFHGRRGAQGSFRTIDSVGAESELKAPLGSCMSRVEMELS